MSKDNKNPITYKLPESNILKVHEDEPSYNEFILKDEIMQLDIPLKRRIILNYVVQLQSIGYCNASNDWFAKKTNTKDKDSISTQMIALEDAGLINIKLIYEYGTEQILERRIRPSRRLNLILENGLTPLPPKVQVGVPPKVQEIIPKGIASVKSLKRKVKKSPSDPKIKWGREV